MIDLEARSDEFKQAYLTDPVLCALVCSGATDEEIIVALSKARGDALASLSEYMSSHPRPMLLTEADAARAKYGDDAGVMDRASRFC